MAAVEERLKEVIVRFNIPRAPRISTIPSLRPKLCKQGLHWAVSKNQLEV